VEHRHAGDPRHGAGDLPRGPLLRPLAGRQRADRGHRRLGQRPQRPADHERVAG
jgi:hypothetical protein